MLDELKAIKSTKKELRQFSRVMAGAGAVIGGIMLWKHNPQYPWYLGGGALFLLTGIIVPQALLPLQKLWMAIAVILGWIMTRVILTVLFYAVVTPVGLAARLFGKDFLDIRPGKARDTYWVPRPDGKFDKTSYENQF